MPKLTEKEQMMADLDLGNGNRHFYIIESICADCEELLYFINKFLLLSDNTGAAIQRYRLEKQKEINLSQSQFVHYYVEDPRYALETMYVFPVHEEEISIFDKFRTEGVYDSWSRKKSVTPAVHSKRLLEDKSLIHKGGNKAVQTVRETVDDYTGFV